MPEHTYFKSGEWNAACDICGRVFKSSQLSKTWDNSMRCSACWETRHPQDFIKAMPDDPSVAWARPWVAPSDLLLGIWINNSNDIVPWEGFAGNVVIWGT